MIRALALALTIAAAAPAAAVECPEGSSAEPLIAFNWEYTSASYVMVAVRNTFEKEVRMVDAEIYFQDGLGRLVGRHALPVDPDLAIFPGKANSYQVLAPMGYERLAKAEVGDFELTMCTRAILFKDGSKLEYGQ